MAAAALETYRGYVLARLVGFDKETRKLRENDSLVQYLAAECLDRNNCGKSEKSKAAYSYVTPISSSY
jgi:hypothetical protein